MSAVVQGRPTGSTRPASFDIEAHRGGRALRPENTLQSFANALSMGVDTLELDMAVTKDGVIVVSHERGLNPDLARAPDGLYRASAWHSLRQTDARGGQEVRMSAKFVPAVTTPLGFPTNARCPGPAYQRSPKCSNWYAGLGSPRTPEHRDQDRSESSGRIARPGALRRSCARSAASRELCGPRHD